MAKPFKIPSLTALKGKDLESKMDRFISSVESGRVKISVEGSQKSVSLLDIIEGFMEWRKFKQGLIDGNIERISLKGGGLGREWKD